LLRVGRLSVNATADGILLTGLIVVIIVAMARMTITSIMLFLDLAVAAISAVFIAIFVAILIPIAVGLVLHCVRRFVDVVAGVGIVLDHCGARARVVPIVG
jgi:hypothetical protein